MHILIVEIDVKPDQRERFLEILTHDASQSVAVEPGCVRFEILEDAETPNRFYFYEVYSGPEAIDAHYETPHFQRFAEALPELAAGELRKRVAIDVHPDAAAWAS